MIIGILVSVLVGLGLSSLFWPYFLAHYNLFFTFIKEGEGKIIVQGQTYSGFIFSLKGHRMSPDGNIEAMPSLMERKEFLKDVYGAYWVGIPPFRQIYAYPLRWTSYKPKGQNGERAPEINDEVLSTVFLKDKVYYGLMLEVETSEGIPLRIEFLATLRVVNPYKAIFLVAHWVETIIDRIAQQGRVYVGRKTYKDLLTGETSDPRHGFSGFMFNSPTPGVQSLAEFILEKYGVQFISCDFLKIDPTGNYREETTRAYLAEQNATAVKIEAEAKATATRVTGQADADMITAKGNAEAESLEKRIEAFSKGPDAAKALLDAEVGKALSVGAIAEAIGQGLGWKTKEKKP